VFTEEEEEGRERKRKQSINQTGEDTMLKLMHKQKGFTLIELMIVVAIIGILAAIAIPNFLRFQAKSKQSEAKTNLGAIGTSAESYRVEKDTYVVTTIDDLGWAPQGTVRYGYFYDVSGAVTMFPLATSTWSGNPASPLDSGCQRDDTGTFTVAPVVNLGPPQSFIAVAKGQIDSDANCDEWTYTNLRVLNNSFNDVAN
jgi:type IV pilus assembly protein PilA